VDVPPYRIETPRLVIRCWQPEDASLLEPAVSESLDDLRPWMPWAHEEPLGLDRRVDLLRGFRSQFDRGEDFIYGLFDTAENEVLGGTGLHTRVGDDALEIGYWIRSSAAGCGLATEASAAVTRAAFTHCAVDRVEIHVDPENARSIRIPQRLGFTREARLKRRLPPLVAGGPRHDAVVFSMFAEDWYRSKAAEVAITAFDSAGRPLP
jgi:RimJ/RimL family protein N-acetyltransferase